ncbi:MAG: glucose 1-dehydrogenase [Muribaculaceae bacterium]|nr:glucose 1-dehydrogenase [Muribaculaceae bacterium]
MTTQNPQTLFDLTGKTAIVTGAGDGIGKACAMLLAAAGASVVVSDLDISKAEAVAQSITASSGKAIASACNVLDFNDLQKTVDTATDTFGSVNILVNNAGLGGGGRENPFNIDEAYVEKIYKINVFAPLQLSKLVVPLMQKSGYGSIVNITSMSSIDREANMCVYSSSKAALNHLAANLAHDFGPMGVRINNVGPGATRTAALARILTPELEEKMLRHTPIKRLGEVSDIARAVLFFASPASAWISGQTLFVNGGGDQTLD